MATNADDFFFAGWRGNKREASPVVPLWRFDLATAPLNDSLRAVSIVGPVSGTARD